MVENKELDAIMENDWIIHSLIHQRYPLYPNKEDLYQTGVMALLRAYRHFDPSYGVKFSTYAYLDVMGEISRYVKDDRSIRVSHDVLKLNATIEKAREKLTQVYLRPPTTSELSMFIGIPEEKILQAKASCEYVKSLDYCLNDDEDMNLYDAVATIEPSFDAPITDVRIALSRLPEEDRRLIVSRYYEDKTQEETSRLFGISQVQAYRKEQKILQKMKEHLVA